MKYLLSTLPLISGVAMAHPGHNHADWTAPLLHVLWIAPIAVTLIAATYFVATKINNKNK